MVVWGDLRKELEIAADHTMSWEDAVDSVEGIVEKIRSGQEFLVS